MKHVQKLRASVEKVVRLRSVAQAFDLDLAYSLYSALLGPLEPLLADKAHLIVVNSGALTSCRCIVLVTQKPSEKPSVRDFFSAYRSAAMADAPTRGDGIALGCKLEGTRTKRCRTAAVLRFWRPAHGPAQAPSGGSARAGRPGPDCLLSSAFPRRTRRSRPICE